MNVKRWIGWLIAAMVAPVPTATAQTHPFLAIEGRYVTEGPQAYGLLWQGEERPPLALEIATPGLGQAIVRWQIGDTRHAAAVIGRIDRFSYRQVSAPDDLDGQCSWVEMAAVNGRVNTLRTRLTCRPDGSGADVVTVTLVIDATLDVSEHEPPRSVEFSVSEFPTGARFAARRFAARLVRVP